MADSTLRLVAVLFVFAVPAIVGTSGQSSVAQASTKIKTPISISLRSDIATRQSASFEFLLKRWQKRYGAEAVDPLLEIALDATAADPDRYIALMGAAKLGGYATAPRVAQFLHDPSWMLRSASLRLLGGFQDKAFAPAVLPLLHDPALVVRLEAVATVEKLRAPGSAEALLAVISDDANYHGGQALWVPQRALLALAELRAREATPRLLPLLDHTADPRLLERTVNTLDALNGRGGPGTDSSGFRVSLKSRVAAWKAELSGEQMDSLSEKSAAERHPTSSSSAYGAKTLIDKNDPKLTIE